MDPMPNETASGPGAVAWMESLAPFAFELAFTELYRANLGAHPAIRESACLQVLVPHLLEPIGDGDRFAGRISRYPLVGFGLEQATGGPGYYCDEPGIQRRLGELGADFEGRDQVEAMIAFWRTEATIPGRLVTRLPADTLEATTNRIARMFGRLAGALVDYDKLLRVGIPGLINEVENRLDRALREQKNAELFEGMSGALGLLIDTCLRYANHARDLAIRFRLTPSRHQELLSMADDLDHLIVSRPESLAQAMQLSWLYTLLSGAVNHGRMDIYLGDFYARDIDRGRLNEAEALRLLQSQWRMIADREIVFNSRIVVGGLGRRNEDNADRFALAAMEATRTVIETTPQLSLRFYRGMNPALMDKALDVIGEGRTFPMLYNDDVNVTAVAEAFGVSEEEAEQYYPYGCGEYALDHRSFGSPNCSLNLLKALEVTLHNGRDALSGEPIGLGLGDFRDFADFEALFAAYSSQVAHHCEHLARRHAMEYEVEDEAAAWLYLSMLYDGCMESGRSVVGRGPRYTGGVVESFGLVNAADSLSAIKQLVYDRKVMTPDQMLEALDAPGDRTNRAWNLMRQVPKFGNDDDRADAMVCRVSDQVAETTREQAPKVGLDYFLVVNINNYGNIKAGEDCAASADGRASGTPVANGNTPTAGNDRKGVTAFLNSIVKVDPNRHAGYVHNMKFTPSLFREDRPKLEALLGTYFEQGGTQAMISVVSRGDLEAAFREPGKYGNLIVRVGGFSARFVELSREVQQDLINRTLY